MTVTHLILRRLTIVFTIDIIITIVKMMVWSTFYIGMGINERYQLEEGDIDDDSVFIEHNGYFKIGLCILVLASMKLLHCSSSRRKNLRSYDTAERKRYNFWSGWIVYGFCLSVVNLLATLLVAGIDSLILSGQNGEWRSPIAWTLASFEASILLNFILNRIHLCQATKNNTSNEDR
ncbi:uncharacterized protein LOC110850408 [Folsomia candida]|uniref:Uncharacterized protein n=1 Tax=Folsomia candida TaxID=158441 RepID=A0A226EA81_FOLCA|nr:uncharacterized protein LOC110850408 [Folsomia candida]OXA54310.1 hypothetical protein Fcan01_11007 [Folsomia candida]